MTATTATAPPFRWGAYTGMSLAAFAAMVGCEPQIENIFLSTGSIDFPAKAAELADKAGAEVMLSWEPDNSISHVLAGGADQQATTMAEQCAAYGKPLLVRPWREMTGSWYPWGVALGVKGSTASVAPADYVAAWQHLVALFKDVGASNAGFVWCIAGSATKNCAECYPGDADVAMLGFDRYNRNPSVSQPWGVLSAGAYAALTAISSKPIMVAEFASIEYGPGTKAAWIKDAFSTMRATQPQIEAACWLNGGGTGGARAYELTSSTASLSAFSGAVAGFTSTLTP